MEKKHLKLMEAEYHDKWKKPKFDNVKTKKNLETQQKRKSEKIEKLKKEVPKFING